MPYQVDDALLHAMSGYRAVRVRTELRLLPEPDDDQRLLMSEEPTLLCNQVKLA